MTASMMLQSKISRMKKRLSEDSSSTRCVSLSIFVLFAIYGFAMRAATMGSRYGHISMDIPVAEASIKDPRYSEGQLPKKQLLDESTSVIVLTTGAYFFGDLQSFGDGFANVRNKFIVPHEDGAPNTPRLLDQMGRWLTERRATKGEFIKQPVILIPEAEVPVPVVIQVAQQLKTSPAFDRVILGTGML